MPQEQSSFKKLVVWQRSAALATSVYKITATFPQQEKYGLASQMQRAAVSIASNLAEGSGRAGRKEFAQFVSIALGSACELETQVEIASNIGLLQEEGYREVTQDIIEIKMMLARLRATLMR